MKAQHELKIVGVHYAVNPNYQEMEPSPEMEERTIEVLKNLNEKLPRVVLMPEPTNPVDQLAVMARVRGKRIGYVSRFHLGAVHRILKQQVDSEAIFQGYRLAFPENQAELDAYFIARDEYWNWSPYA
jgi:hypothetical protein